MHKTLVRQGSVFIEPKMPLDRITPEVAEAVEFARGEASHPYGDEGNGYEGDLTLAYLIDNPVFKSWMKENLDLLDAD